MTQEEYNKFEAELKAKGYRQYPSANDGDFAYYRGFGESKYEEDRSNYQVCFDVYDFGKYANREPYFRTHPYGIEPRVLVSRTINERMDLTLASSSVKEVGVDRIEQLAESFFWWVEKEVKL